MQLQVRYKGLATSTRAAISNRDSGMAAGPAAAATFALWSAVIKVVGARMDRVIGQGSKIDQAPSGTI